MHHAIKTIGELGIVLDTGPRRAQRFLACAANIGLAHTPGGTGGATGRSGRRIPFAGCSPTGQPGATTDAKSGSREGSPPSGPSTVDAIA